MMSFKREDEKTLVDDELVKERTKRGAENVFLSLMMSIIIIIYKRCSEKHNTRGMRRVEGER
jgi:hypothetical protein